VLDGVAADRHRLLGSTPVSLKHEAGADEVSRARAGWGAGRRTPAQSRTLAPGLAGFFLMQGVLCSQTAGVVYFNDFNGPLGSAYHEWLSSPTAYTNRTDPPGSAVLPAPPVTNTECPNGARRFLGEFGGPRIGQPADAGYNRTRVKQTLRLALTNLPPHSALQLSFDLLVLKSWDGNSPVYGPDRWTLEVVGGPVLLDTTFSNNPKVSKEGSDQDYPAPHAAPRSGAARTNSLGYAFFGDSAYPLEFTFPHSGAALELNFSSSLFEGKGVADESWGLDNVRVSLAPGPGETGRSKPPAGPR
jgi:hypothetical protein